MSRVDTWADVATALGVSVPAADEFLRAWRPQAAEALDAVDARVGALRDAAEDAGSDGNVTTIVIKFGNPTKRQRADGFWTSPKAVWNEGQDTGGELYLLVEDESIGWTQTNVGLRGVRGTVVAVKTSGGYGGGNVAVTVALA
jgi:hypothetical protein